MTAEPSAPPSNLLQALAASPRRLRGRGVNHEGEDFVGELVIEPLVGGAAVLLRYRAVLDDGSSAHEEATLLGRGPDGRLALWPVMSELEVVLPHVEIEDSDPPREGDAVRAVFATGPLDDDRVFREAITIEWRTDGSLTYAHAWGLPGGPCEARSSCRMV